MQQQTKKFMSFTLLQYLLYGGRLELNLKYLQGMPVYQNIIFSTCNEVTLYYILYYINEIFCYFLGTKS